MLGPLFEQAWEHWPKKVEKKPAREKFLIAARKIDPQALLEHVTQFGDAYAATTEKHLVPALGRWLNNERWTDDLPQSRQAQQQAPRQSRGAQALEFAMQLPEGGNQIGSQRDRPAIGGGVEY